MGNGEKARNRADTAYSLAKRFFEAGFEKETIINTVNKIMLISGGDESYSTIDICEIDTVKSNCTFIKTGAPSSFIVRNGQVWK